MTITASYASNVERGETSACVSPSSSHLPLSVLDPGRAKKLPFAAPPTGPLPSDHVFKGWSAYAFSYVSYGHLADIYSEFARVHGAVDRATEIDLSNSMDDLITETVATDPTEAMDWTLRTYRLSATPDSALPILSIEDFED